MSEETKALMPDYEQIGVPEEVAVNINKKFNKVSNRIIPLEEEYNAIMRIPATEITYELCKKARSLRLDLRSIRTEGEAIRKSEKSIYLKVGKAIDAFQHLIVAATSNKEENLLKIENYFEDLKNAKIEKIRLERIAELMQYGMSGEHLNLGQMDDVVYGNMLLGAKTGYEAKIKAEAEEAERLRLEKEQKEVFTLRREKLLPYSSLVDISSLGLSSTEEDFNALLQRCIDAKEKDKEEREKALLEAEEAKRKSKIVVSRLELLSGITISTESILYLGAPILSVKEIGSMQEEDFQSFAKAHNEKVEDARKRKEKEDAAAAAKQAVKDQELADLKAAEESRKAEAEAEKLKEEEAKAEAERLKSAGDNDRLIAWVGSFAPLPEMDTTGLAPDAIIVHDEIARKYREFKKDWLEQLYKR